MSDKVTLKEKISYALVNLGNIPIQTILGSYLLIFYTNIVGLSPASCATLFLIARVLDGLNDPFVGFAIDHIPTTLVVGSILCALNFLLLWFGPLMATSGKLAIAYVSYLLIGVLFPVMDISLNSMLPVMTTDMEERNMLSSLKGVVYMVGMFGLSFLREDIMRKEKHFPWHLPQMQIMPMQEWKKIRRKQGRILRHCLMYIQRLSIME